MKLMGFGRRTDGDLLSQEPASVSLEVQPHVRSMLDPKGAVLLDLKGGRYFSLNSLGARIWSKAEEGATLGEILEHLQQLHQKVPPEKLQQDAIDFLRSMSQKGLIRART